MAIGCVDEPVISGLAIWAIAGAVVVAAGAPEILPLLGAVDRNGNKPRPLTKNGEITW